MGSTLDTLIGRVADEALRSELRAAAADLRKLTAFGLVFESHIPETGRLPHHPIPRGVKATYRDGTDGSIFEVVKVNGAKVTVETSYKYTNYPSAEVPFAPSRRGLPLASRLLFLRPWTSPVMPNTRTMLAGASRKYQ